MTVSVSGEDVEYCYEHSHEQADQQGIGPEDAAADEPEEKEGNTEKG